MTIEVQMKATELRIGNLVEETHSGEFGKVDMVVLSIIERMSNHSYRPIPLTEEWLVRFGFNKVSHIWEFWKNSGWDLRQHKLEDKWWLFYMGQDLDCVRIDYVHQLQNLYFALTGEELELKP